MAVVPVVRSLLGPLARVPQEPRRWYDVILWWELRRIPYNLIVGIVGMAGIVLYIYIDTLPPQLPPEQLQFEYGPALLLRAMLGNFFYTGGWVCELVLRSLTRQQIRWFGPVMFSLGLMLSLALPTLEVALDILYWLFRVVTRA